MIRLEIVAVTRDVTTPPASTEEASSVEVTAAVDTAMGAALASGGVGDSRQAPSSIAEPDITTSQGMVLRT
jgi:hypothetical protein